MNLADRLQQQHDAFLLQLDGLAQSVAAGGDVRQALASLGALARPLLNHAGNEESCLFPALVERIGRQGPVAALEQEHRVLEGQVNVLVAEPHREKFVKIYDAFDRLLREHIEKERQVLLPLSRELLGEEQLTELDRRWERLPD